MRQKALYAYIIIVLLAEVPVVFLSPEAAGTYISVQVFAIGILAMVFQKVFHLGMIAEMGFRVNRNMLVGLCIASLFVIATVFIHGVLPYWLGWVEFVRNEGTTTHTAHIGPVAMVAILLVFGGAAFFVAIILGEELAFRGYILPKLEGAYGRVSAVLVCSAVFGLWHLPDYFSFYSGGADNWPSVMLQVLVHILSTMPLCILYLTTRELYGVSLYHALLGVIQYCIVANPSMGEASKNAMYYMKELNGSGLDLIGWIWLVVSVPLMVIVCRWARTLTLKSERV